MTKFTFSCEQEENIPLPLDGSFARAFYYLDPESNSFFILDREDKSYIQCGGSKERCTIETRMFDGPDQYKHFIFGYADGSNNPTTIEMSEGIVHVTEREVLTVQDAIHLFECFFYGNGYPNKYILTKKEM